MPMKALLTRLTQRLLIEKPFVPSNIHKLYWTQLRPISHNHKAVKQLTRSNNAVLPRKHLQLRVWLATCKNEDERPSRLLVGRFVRVLPNQLMHTNPTLQDLAYGHAHQIVSI